MMRAFAVLVAVFAFPLASGEDTPSVQPDARVRLSEAAGFLSDGRNKEAVIAALSAYDAGLDEAYPLVLRALAAHKDSDLLLEVLNSHDISMLRDIARIEQTQMDAAFGVDAGAFSKHSVAACKHMLLYQCFGGQCRQELHQLMGLMTEKDITTARKEVSIVVGRVLEQEGLYRGLADLLQAQKPEGKPAVGTSKQPAVPGPATFQADNKSLPAAAVESDGHHYLAVEAKLTWHEARQACVNLGGHLVTIGSDRENQFVGKLTGGRGFWIGLTDEHEEGKWKWVDGTHASKAPWVHVAFGQGARENYAIIRNNSGTLYWLDNADAGLSYVHGYVCEWDE